jgi:arylsulfatase A-like enzyme
MGRRGFASLPFAALLLGLALLSCGGERAAEPPRRVFLVTFDTLRADHLGAYGYGRDTSPRLDALAGEGVLFERAIAQWPKTGASFASLFTGRYPQSTGLLQRAALRVPAEYLTLPELFREAGYTTVAVVSNPVLGSELGWDSGFDEYLQTWGGAGFPHDAHAFRHLMNAPRVNELAGPLLARHAEDPKLFAWIHYTDPHAPYVLPPGEANPFRDDGLYRFAEQVPPGALRKYGLEGRKDRTFYVSQYDANVRVADAHAGELLDRARALGLLEDALVVITADHGESLGEHDSWFDHGPLPYNTTSHVPLVLLGDGVPRGRRVAEPVELVDLYPTLRELIAPGREVAGLEGQSLAPLLRGSAKGVAGGGVSFSEAGHRPRYYRSVQDRSWKLVQALGGGRRREPASPRFELYDLAADPLETRDLAAGRPEEVRRLRRALVGWTRPGTAYRRPPEVNEREEAKAALDALGYN